MSEWPKKMTISYPRWIDKQPVMAGQIIEYMAETPTSVIPSTLGRELFNALNAATPRGCGCRQCKQSRATLEHYESEVQL